VGKVIWSNSALDDADTIAEYIAKDSVDRASLFVLRLMESTERLKSFPFSGRIIPEFGDENRREIIYYSYRIMYQVVETDVWITSIIHGSRQIN